MYQFTILFLVILIIWFIINLKNIENMQSRDRLLQILELIREREIQTNQSDMIKNLTEPEIQYKYRNHKLKDYMDIII